MLTFAGNTPGATQVPNPMGEALLSVVLLGTGDPASIAESLTSVLEYCVGIERADLTVVLHGPAVASQQLFAGLGNDLRILTTAPGTSDSDAWSTGISAAPSRWVLLVSDDIRLTHGWLSPILNFITDNPDTTAVTPSVSTNGVLDVTAAPDAANGVCLVISRSALTNGTIGAVQHVEASQVLSIASPTSMAALTPAPVFAAPGAFVAPPAVVAPTAFVAPPAFVAPTPAAAPVAAAPLSIPGFTPRPDYQSDAPGNGAPPGPVHQIGNALFAGASAEDKKKRLHLGSGPGQIAGWLNVDGDPLCSPDMVMDLRNPMPLPDNSVELIFSEHFIEHFTLEQAMTLLADCYRVMKPGGVIRTAMPNLRDGVLLYLGRWQEQGWLRDYPWIDSPARMLNTVLREWGHLYVYDEDELTLRLTQLGFANVVSCPNGQSTVAALQGLEIRPESTLILEATKPA